MPNFNMNEKENQLQSDWERVSALVGSLTEQQVRNALAEILMENKEVEDWLALKYSRGITDKYIDSIKDAVQQCYTAFCQKIQIHGDNDMGDFFQGLKKILNDKVQLLIEKKNYIEAFEMTLYVMKMAGSAQGKDKYGAIYTLTNTCLAIWQNILWDCDEEQKKVVHKGLTNLKSKGYDEFFFKYEMSEIVDEILAEEFDDESILKEQLEVVDKNIQKIIDESGEEELAFFKGYPHPILERISLMEKLKYPENEIQEFKDLFMFVPDLRLAETKKVIANKDYDKAKRMIAVSKDVDNGRPEWEKIYSDLLISIYALTNDISAYREELMNNIKTFEQDTTYNVERLKMSMDEEQWPEWRDKVLSVMKLSRGRLDLLYSEGMHRELLDELQSHFGAMEMEKYADNLAEEFPMEIIEYYIGALQDDAAGNGSPEVYSNMMIRMKKLEKMPGGQLIVDGLAAEWREKFSQNVQLMEYLQQAGY